MKAFVVAVYLGAMALAGCSSGATSDDFRTGERPEFERRASADDVEEILGRGGAVLDVRLREDYQSNPVLIPNAQYRDPEKMADWAREIRQSDGPVVVYCVRGKWVSQKVAHFLNTQGVEVYSLEDGIDAWQADGLPTVTPD